MEAVPVLLEEKVVFLSLTTPGKDAEWITRMTNAKDPGTGDVVIRTVRTTVMCFRCNSSALVGSCEHMQNHGSARKSTIRGRRVRATMSGGSVDVDEEIDGVSGMNGNVPFKESTMRRIFCCTGERTRVPQRRPGESKSIVYIGVDSAHEGSRPGSSEVAMVAVQMRGGKEVIWGAEVFQPRLGQTERVFVSFLHSLAQLESLRSTGFVLVMERNYPDAGLVDAARRENGKRLPSGAVVHVDVLFTKSGQLGVQTNNHTKTAVLHPTLVNVFAKDTIHIPEAFVTTAEGVDRTTILTKIALSIAGVRASRTRLGTLCLSGKGFGKSDDPWIALMLALWACDRGAEVPTMHCTSLMGVEWEPVFTGRTPRFSPTPFNVDPKTIVAPVYFGAHGWSRTST